MTDGELLHRYAAGRDGEAFAELVRRHGPMVHAAAKRLAGADAEDVTQAVFLLLAQKAGGLARQRNVAGWLYNAARYCAANARRTRARRARHLEAYRQEAAVTQASSSSVSSASSSASATDPAVSELLDAGLARLKDDQRQAVLLRYIEGLTLDEAAARLGINAAAVAKRAERGIARLREHFAARGVTLADAALAAAPVPPTVLAHLAETAAAGATAPGAAAATIASGATKAMTLAAAAKVAAVVALAAAGITATVGVAGTLKSAAPKPALAAATPTAPPATDPVPAPAPAPADVTEETGRAVAAAFTRGLRDRDEEAVAKWILAPSPDEARAAAAGFIAEVRDGPYARFPQRLERIVGTSFTTSREGQPIEMLLETAPPTDADVRRVSIHLKPSGGGWRVAGMKLAAVQAFEVRAAVALVGAATGPATGPAPQPGGANVPPDTYAKAAAIHATLRSRLSSADMQAGFTDADRPAVLASLDGMRNDLRQLADVLRPTDLGPIDEPVRVFDAALARMRDALEQRGVAAFRAVAKDLPKDEAAAAAVQRVFALEETLTQRADAEADARRTGGPRPPAFAPPVRVTFAWDGTAHDVPGPVAVPPWFRDSETFKLWQKRHDVRTFRTRDDAGNGYEIHCMGAVKGADGRTREMIPSVRLYRADGTLAASAQYDSFGHATEWGAFDASGTKYVTRVTMASGPGGHGAPMRVARVTFFDAQDNQRVWEVDEGNRVTAEVLKNPLGDEIKTLRAAPKPPRKQGRAATTRAAS